MRVIGSREEQLRIVHACHEGLGESLQSKALSGHFGCDKTQARMIVSENDFIGQQSQKMFKTL